MLLISYEDFRSLPVGLPITLEAPHRIITIDPIFGTIWIVVEVFEINEIAEIVRSASRFGDSPLTIALSPCST